MALAFGRQVMVRALTLRVIAYRDGDTERFKIPQANDLPWVDATADEWPGEPIDLLSDLPKGPRFQLEPSLNGLAIIRYRRFPLDVPQIGFVASASAARRHEGSLKAAEPGAWVPGGSMIGPKRTLHLHQVALQPPGRSVKALIVLVHPDDMTGVGDREVITERLAGRLGNVR